MSTKSRSTETAENIMARIRSKHKVGADDIAAPVKHAMVPQKGSAKPAIKAAAPKPAIKAAAPKPVPTAKAPKAPKEHPLCACGCNERTKGGTYRPGHDSKHRSAQAGPKVSPSCMCGCGGQTKGGKYLPGHDAKHHSALRKIEKEAAKHLVQTPRLHLATNVA